MDLTCLPQESGSFPTVYRLGCKPTFPDLLIYREHFSQSITFRAVPATLGCWFNSNAVQARPSGSLSKIQVATTNAGARSQGGLTPDFLALSGW
jgi:hypothetical protein